MSETKSFPVRYMVVYDGGCDRLIVDTSNGNQDVICYNVNEGWAHHICNLLNEYEGYHYE